MFSERRFGAVIRVSTEQQEKTGESLRTQKTDIEQAVKHLGGGNIRWYGGQEHGTPGYEKKEIDRLLQDARNGLLDAVIVAHADRWSRDNTKSREGLEVFKQYGVEFYVGTTHYDLFNPEHVLFLGMSAVLGHFQAMNQNRKSLQNRISRAKRGVPSAGKLPFGRTFDRQTSQWGVDEKKKAMIQEIAQRYLAGESMPELAHEYRINHSNLHKTLMLRCGTEWVQEFDSDELNIHEHVPTTVPPLLDVKTIKALRQKAEANKTYQHGRPKHPYLFSGMVFCDHCGYSLFGQTSQRGHRYYRHPTADRDRICPCRPRPYVRCDDLESTVIRHLFEVFGNPQAVERAIQETVPNIERLKELRQRAERLQDDLKRIEVGRSRILRCISNGSITEEQADGELGELKRRESKVQREIGSLQDQIGDHPSPDAIQKAAKEASAAFQRRLKLRALTRRAAKIRLANVNFEEMTWQESQALANAVFNGQTAVGKPMGIYVRSLEAHAGHRRKRWSFTLFGQVLNGRECQHHSVDGFKLVTPSALHSPGTTLPARRFAERSPPPAA